MNPSSKPAPEIIRTDTLNAVQRTAIETLMETCQNHDGAAVSYPFEEEARHYLLVCGEELLAALACIPLDETSAECIAYTLPSFRRKGCFRALLDALLEEDAEKDLFFPVRGNVPDTLMTLKTIDAEWDHCDLEMCLELPPDNLSEDTAPHSQTSVQPENRQKKLEQAILQSWTPHASFCLTPVSGQTLCLHSVQVEEAYRGNGIGTAMLNHLIPRLSGLGYRQVILHVSGDNLPAISLYKKTGFRITETLSYYLF